MRTEMIPGGAAATQADDGAWEYRRRFERMVRKVRSEGTKSTAQTTAGTKPCISHEKGIPEAV